MNNNILFSTFLASNFLCIYCCISSYNKDKKLNQQKKIKLKVCDELKTKKDDIVELEQKLNDLKLENEKLKDDISYWEEFDNKNYNGYESTILSKDKKIENLTLLNELYKSDIIDIKKENNKLKNNLKKYQLYYTTHNNQNLIYRLK